MENARILVVDDQEDNVRLLSRMLRRAGYLDVAATTDPAAAVPLARDFCPDLILLDLHMPRMDGFQVMEALDREMPDRGYLPIICLTADTTPEARDRALSGGARDFLTKPFDGAEVLLRIRNLLETRSLYAGLERRVRERTRALEDAQAEVLERLAQAAELRDDDTGQHTRRVGQMAAATARFLGLGDDEVELVRRAAPLHDVGKIGIPDAILLKRGPLSEAERAVMRTHTEIGARILANGRSALMGLAETIARAHHERWDGAGYPACLAAEAIPLAARIVAVVDVFDALAHDRAYRPAWAPELVLAEIRAGAGAHFDPAVVEAFFAAHAAGALTADGAAD